MENKDHSGSGSLSGVCVRDVDLQGRCLAAFLAESWTKPPFADLSAEGLATLLEAVAEELASQAQVLRSRGVR